MNTSTATKTKKRPLILSVVFKPDELARVEALAKQEVRTKSSMARLLINEALAARALSSTSN